MAEVTVVKVETEGGESVLPGVAQKLLGLLKEARNARVASGIEGRWAYAEDAYNGEDEATKGRARVLKPSAPGAPFTVSKAASDGWQRSVAFLNITRPYVDVAAARVAEMLVPNDERSWELRPTPKKEIEIVAPVVEQIEDPELLQEAAEMLSAEFERVDRSVADAQKQIDDWLNESDWNPLVRKLIHDAARVGTGVVKGPVSVEVEGRAQPGVRLVKVQNLFPSPDCGDDLQNGDYVFEREEMSRRLLREKIGQEESGWIRDSILACLKEGPKGADSAAVDPNAKARPFVLWHYQGEIDVDALLECDCPVPDEAGAKAWAHITLCGDYIVRVATAPVQGEFTYRTLAWQRRDGFWAGIGVAEQLETPQRGLNGAIRNLFDNAALSALPQIVYWKNVLNPVNGRFEIKPGKVWQVADDERPISDVKNAILAIEIPSRQPELMQIVSLMRDLAQETTGLPLVVMGTGSTGAVGSDQLQTNAATIVLRRLAKEFDSSITDPLISAFYRWIREYGVLDVPEAVVDARGSSVLVERDIQAQALIQMVQLSKDPTYGIDPKLVAAEWMRSQKFDPKRVALSPEREQELSALLSQPDEKAQAAVESAQLRAEALTQQGQMKAEAAIAQQELKIADAERERQHDKVMLDLEYRYKLIEYAMQRNIDLATAQREIAEVQTPFAEGTPA